MLSSLSKFEIIFRFSAYYDPGRDTIDPCRTTQFHAYFKPLHVIQAKYQRDKGLNSHHKNPPQIETHQIHMVPTPSSKSEISDSADLPSGLVDELLSELIRSELEDVVMECTEESSNEAIVSGLINNILDDVVNEEAKRASSEFMEGVLDKVFTNVDPDYQPAGSDQFHARKIKSNFSLFSDLTPRDSYTEYSSDESFDFQDLVEDVVKKIMACFNGKHHEVYEGQTSTTDCSERDGEDIITEIIVRLIATLQAFTKLSGDQSVESSAHDILSPSQSSSRENLKDLHKRAQFLLNHALDVAKVKLKLKGYSYLTWNILEDCLKKARDKILSENPSRVCQFTDIELVEWIMEEAKFFLQGATTMLYEMLHDHTKEASGSMSSENQQIVEDCYMDQLEKSDHSIDSVELVDRMLEKCAREGDIAKFSVLLVKKTLNNAMATIPRTSSIMLCEALRDGNFDRAGSILSAKAVKVAYEQLVLDPQCPSEMKLRDAISTGDTVQAGTILANRALQQAMDIISSDADGMVSDISSMVLSHAIQEDDLVITEDVVIDKSLREAIDYLKNSVAETTLEQALIHGDLEVAGAIMADNALELGLVQIMEEVNLVRHESSIALDCALKEGNLPGAGEVLINRALRNGIADLEPRVLRRDSSIALEDALDSGDLSDAGDIIVRRLLESGMSEVDEEIAAGILTSSSSVVLQSSLRTGNLDAAAPILVQRALKSAQSNPEEDEAGVSSNKTPSDLKLDASLKEGNLEAAADIITDRALKSPSKTPSELILDDSLQKGNLETAADILTYRALISPTKTPSDLVLDASLEEGDLDTAADIISNQALKSPTKTPSDLVLDASLEEGNLDTAADIILNRALKSPTKTPSDLVLDAFLEEGNLDTAADIIASRALRSPAKTPSDMVLEASIEEGDLNTAADIITQRALKSPTKTPSELVLESSLNDGHLDAAAEILSYRALTSPTFDLNSDLDMEPVKESVSFDLEEPKVIPTVSFHDIENVEKPSFYDCIYFLEAPRQAESDDMAFVRGEKIVIFIIDNVRTRMERTFDEDAKNGYKILRPSLQNNDFNGTAKVLTKILLDEMRLEIENYFYSKKQRTKVVALTALLVFKSCLEVLRGSPGFEIVAISILINDFVRSTLNEINRNSGNEAVLSLIIGKCISIIANTKTMKVRTDSSVELFEACGAGDKKLAGEVLTQKVLKKAEFLLNDSDMEKFRSANEILDEKSAEKNSTTASLSLKSNKSKRKINTEGLPMPKPLSSSSSKASSNYDPIRKIIISEERELMVNQMVSNSERLIKTNSQTSSFQADSELRSMSSIEHLAKHSNQEIHKRDVGDAFFKHPSDQSLPILSDMSTSSSLGCVRKIQSKDHVYYINEGGVVKKRAKKKRSSKRRISQDDLSIIQAPPDMDSGATSHEPQAVSSETNLIQPSPPSDIPSESSKKSIEHRRSSFKKKESSLQMLAVINSSYTNMVGKKSADCQSETINFPDKIDDPTARGMSSSRRPSIDELLSDTDKELIQKLSSESINKK